jgi:hypothetical protein
MIPSVNRSLAPAARSGCPQVRVAPAANPVAVSSKNRLRVVGRESTIEVEERGDFMLTLYPYGGSLRSLKFGPFILNYLACYAAQGCAGVTKR